LGLKPRDRVTFTECDNGDYRISRAHHFADLRGIASTGEHIEGETIDRWRQEARAERAARNLR
jgi:hypothetical protein